MQTLDAYYYPNSVTVQLNDDPTSTLRNRVMYQRTVKLYKGIDNKIKFLFKNSDQKPVNLTGWDVSMNIISDELGSVLVTTLADLIDPVKGIAVVTIGEMDLINLDKPYYHYSMMVTDPLTGIQQIIYSDDNYDVRGEINLLSGHYPEFRESIDVSLPAGITNLLTGVTSITTSAVTFGPTSRQQSSFHTAQFGFQGVFSGTIDVMGTLDPNPANGGASATLSWALLDSLIFADQIDNAYHTWIGVYSAIQFVITPDPLSTGSVTKILYRP